MGEILLCSHSSPLGEILLYSSFSGGKFYYGGKNYSTTPGICIFFFNDVVFKK